MSENLDRTKIRFEFILNDSYLVLEWVSSVNNLENTDYVTMGRICGKHIDGLVQKGHNFNALAMELRPSWTNPSI